VPPHLEQLCFGRLSTQNLLLQLSHLCAAAIPTSAMYSQLPGSPRFLA